VHLTPLRPRAVVFAAGLPFPPRSGLDLRVLATIRALEASHDVGVFTLFAGAGSDPKVGGSDVKVRVSRRFSTETVTELGARSLEWLREPDGHPSDRWYDEAVCAELAEFAGGHGADTVVLETLWLHGYIAPLLARGYRVVLNAHGIEAALHDELAVRTRAPLAQTFAERTRRLEERAFAAVDGVWVPSAHDAESAHRRYGTKLPIQVVPNVVDTDYYTRPQATPRAGEFTAIFTASFSYPPNAVAARRLLTGIFPELIAQIPAARLSLVGRDPTAEMIAAAAADERIDVTGPVNDVTAHLHRAYAMAVPLTEGHGTRFKVLEAFASELPVVGSAKAVEGIAAVAHEHYLPAETDPEFAAALVWLAHAPQAAADLATRAASLVQERYSLASVSRSVAAALVALQRG
jgi:polysaccharide biosynthesis protein PslH